MQTADILLDIDKSKQRELLQAESLEAATAQMVALNTELVPVDKTVVDIAGSVGMAVAAAEDGRGLESRMLKTLTQLAVLLQEEQQV
jgi:hypothetical protein